MKNFNNFRLRLSEELHKELQDIIHSPTRKFGTSKQTQIANKIKDLSLRGETTGTEGNMPKGSSRAYLKHVDPHPLTIDGEKTTIPTGIKVVIKGSLDKHHNTNDHGGMSLGHIQNRDENSDHYINDAYRVLRKNHDTGEYHHNEEGIFPPLIDHDHDNHEWSHVGHARNITKKEFKDLTKTDEFPKGIEHHQFVDALITEHNRDNGKHHGFYSKEQEKEHNKLIGHPLIDQFLNYHREYNNPPHDYNQIKNMGVFEHGDKKHIVARDHGFSSEAQKAYANARREKWGL